MRVRSDPTAERDAEHAGNEAADQRAQNTHDQVTEDTTGALAGYDHFGQETSDDADHDPKLRCSLIYLLCSLRTSRRGAAVENEMSCLCVG